MTATSSGTGAPPIGDGTERRIAGRYRVIGLLGRGGMGTVWLAEDELLRRPVAVKEIFYPPGLSAHEVEVLRERTLREARSAARLSHPAVVRMYDVVEEDGHPCLVMERLSGRTLAEAVRENGAMSVAAVAGIGLQILGGLEAAHAQGVVHRDVKPSNVVLEDNNRAVLTDFGIAVSAGDSTLTTTGLLVGSPAFMAPERARESRPGPPSDLWSLGATLYTAVEGHPPFPGHEALATLTAVATQDPDPVVLAGPLAPALEGLLRKDPEARLTAGALRGLLEQAERDARSAPETAPPPLPTPGAAPSAAERTLALDAAAVAAAAAGFAVQEAEPAADESNAPARYRDPFAPPMPGPGTFPAAVAASSALDQRLPRAEPNLVGAQAPVEPDVAGRQAGAEPLPVSADLPAASSDGLPPAEASSPAGPPANRSRRGALLAAALVLLAVGGTLAALALTRGPSHATTPAQARPTTAAPSNPAPSSPSAPTPSSPSAPPPSSPSAPRPSSPSSQPPATSTPPPTSAAPVQAVSPGAIPAGWVNYHSPDGWTLAHPADWTTSVQNGETDFNAPGSAAHLRVDTTNTPGPSAVGAWQDQEKTFSAQHAAYHRIYLGPSTYRDYQTADWTFQWQDGAVLLQANDRGMVTGGKGYALFLQTTAAQWSADQGLLQGFYSSFQP